jgi:hypothetical protein
MSHRLQQHPWPREASASPTYQLDTPLGRPFVRALAADRIGVQGGTPHNTDEGAAGALTINGVVHSVNAHFTRWSDGRWHAGAEGGRENWREPHLSRRDHTGREPSRSATDKARAALEDAVNEWAAAHDDLLLAGDRRKRAEDAHHLARQLDEAEAAVRTLRANLDACAGGRDYEVYPLTNRR